jgi:hypothetical protein
VNDDETWLEDVRREAGRCPRCRAVAARPILYGMPSGSDYHRLQGRVAFAGCCLPEVLHLYSCGECDHEWGERRQEPVQTLPQHEDPAEAALRIKQLDADRRVVLRG